jgi:outer membrane protein OmpA-like peptidoglycan-associated protein
VPTKRFGRTGGRPAYTTESTGLQQLSTFLASGQKGEQRFVMDGLTFARDDASLATGGERVADKLATELKAHPGAKIRIEGFSDSTGNPATSQQLSLARANVVKRYLVDRGVTSDRIDTAGMGQEHPIADNRTPEGRAQNRRIEIQVTNE